MMRASAVLQKVACREEGPNTSLLPSAGGVSGPQSYNGLPRPGQLAGVAVAKGNLPPESVVSVCGSRPTRSSGVESSVAVSLCLDTAAEGRHQVVAQDELEPGACIVDTPGGK